MKRLFCGLTLLLLAGCSGTVPVTGQTVDGETFSGTFSRRTDGLGGAVALQSSGGVICDGRWHLDEKKTGSVAVTCSDGRTGTAELTARPIGGTMKGMLGGKYFEGQFDDPSLPQ
ncbi:hypothetical protein [Reyranella sp.]|uniref:hypothetical protein n=1 Tax=Reyranella sp. TaxID=1929291 RepID=UPI003BA960C8